MAEILTAQRKGDTLQWQQSTCLTIQLIRRTAGEKWREWREHFGCRTEIITKNNRDRWKSSSINSTDRQCEAVILREVGDAARGEIVQGEQGMLLTVQSWDSKLRRETNIQADTKGTAHSVQTKQSQSCQTASATILINSSRTHTHRASKNVNSLRNLWIEVQDYATDIPEIADWEFFFSWQHASWLIPHINDCILLRPTKQKKNLWYSQEAAQKTIHPLRLAILACHWWLKEAQKGSRSFAELAVREREGEKKIK